MPVQQTTTQMPGQVAGESGAGAPVKQTDVAGASGNATQASVGQQALGGGGGDVASVLAGLLEQLKALASQVGGISGGGGGGMTPPALPGGGLPGQIPTGPPGKTGANPGHGRHGHGRGHDKGSEVGGQGGPGQMPGQAPTKPTDVGGEQGDGTKAGPPAKK